MSDATAGSLAVFRSFARLAIVAAVYIVAAHVGFQAAFGAEQITTVWPPSGLAIAALLLWGRGLWPAVWVGAFVANAGANAPLWTAVVIATGNTLEALTVAWGLRRLRTFEPGFRRVVDVLAFMGIVALAAAPAAATMGVGALCVAAVEPWLRFPTLWFHWWLGDTLSALVIAPAILTNVYTARWWTHRRGTAVLLLAGAVAATQLIFGRGSAHPFEYVVFPVVIAAALGGGPPVTSLVVLCASAITSWHTLHGDGPFGGADVEESLILLQTFMGVLSATGLLLAAAIVEREASEQRAKDASDVLREREQMLRLAQRAGGVATFEWDFQNQVARCSREFFDIFGVPPGDGVMRGAEWAAFVHPDDRDAMASHLARALAGDEVPSADYRIVRRDGTVRWLSYAGQIQNTPDGQRLLGTVLDVTDRKRSEMALRDAKAAAEEANQVKDRFLATLSHELRTPLNVILGYSRMLQADALTPEMRTRAIDVIARNAVAQNQLVNDLLDMARITSGTIQITPVPLAIDEVLRDAVDGVRPAAEAKRIELAMAVEAPGASVAADATRLQQVFWNLLTNAIKFTSAGGRVEARLVRDGDHVEVAVRDTGVGMAPEVLPHVFEPFRQGDASFERSEGGLGLGLAISRQLVELHGGTIQASSDGAGLGASFTVRLPAVKKTSGVFLRKT